ncbi:MAG: hemerythrin domain-containing protein [Aquabacterium sp.]
MSDPTVPAADQTANPLNAFSDCHAGIVRKLQALEELPALLEAAARARALCTELAAFFHDVVLDHHAEEERELFPAVLASARAGDERAQVEAVTTRLTSEHRGLEERLRRLEPALKAGARGHDATADVAAVQALVKSYLAHARYEEEEFLPLSQEILGRNGNHLAALGISLHMRHALPEVMARFGHRI